MAFDSTAPLTRLVAILEGLAGMGKVYTGVPNAIGPQVAAYVTVAGQQTADDAASNGRALRRETRYMVTFAYQVADAEADAETTLASLLDAFVVAMYTERLVSGSALEGMSLDLSLADTAEYEAVLAQEFRRFSLLVTVTQRHTLTP